MTTAIAEPPKRRRKLTVEVRDPIGQQAVRLDNVPPTATADEVVAMAASELRLPPTVTYNLRHDATSRLLPEKQSIADLAEEEAPHVKVTMQPDAGLG
jgi:hypothetical protein